MFIRMKRKYFERDYRIVRNIYNTIILLSSFCESNQDIEQINNIAPIVEYLEDESDKLCSSYINISCRFESRIKNISNRS